MKGLLIIYAPALECFVMGALENAGQKKYTKMPYLHGVGGLSEPHLDTSIWPGSNSALLIVTDDRTATALLAEVSKLKKQYSDQGIKAFVFPIEEAV
jgi:hypothetical protein